MNHLLNYGQQKDTNKSSPIKYIAKMNRKKMSSGSETTRPQRSRRFIRRNSFHTLVCRQGSLNKLNYVSQELLASSPCLDTQCNHQQPNKLKPLQAQTDNLLKDFEKNCNLTMKRGSGSMKIQQGNRNQKIGLQEHQTLRRQLEAKTKEVQLLEGQSKRYKMYLDEQRQKRKLLEEENRCSRQQIKRLQKRLDKYKQEKQKFQAERQLIVKHISQLEEVKFNEEAKTVHNYKLKIIEQEVSQLREEIRKDRTIREKDLQLQVDKLVEIRFQLEQEIKTLLVANRILSKQIEQGQQQLIQLQQSLHKTVTESYQYLELRDRYRRLLIELKELREEMSILQRGNQSSSSNTLLSLSFSRYELEEL